MVELKSQKELLIYSYRVAGTVGLMMAKILSVKKQNAFKAAIDLWPESWPLNYSTHIYFDRGLMFMNQKEYEKAEDDFNTAIELDTNNNDGYFYRSKYHIRINNLDKAMLDCEKAIEINNSDPEPYFYLGYIYELKNEDFVALRYFDKSITLLKTDKRYYINNLDFSKRIELQDIYMKRGGVFQKMNQNKLMCVDYQKACDLGDCEMFNTNCK